MRSIAAFATLDIKNQIEITNYFVDEYFKRLVLTFPKVIIGKIAQTINILYYQ